MKLTSCPHEKAVRELIADGQWPTAWPPELRAHAALCRSCSDFLLVSEAFRQGREQTLAAAHPVPPAILMWRAQLRRRNAAIERIGRPLFGAQIIAFAVLLLAAVGFVGFEARHGADWATWSYWRTGLTAPLHSIAAQGQNSGPLGWMTLVCILGLAVMLGGAAVYLKTGKS